MRDKNLIEGIKKAHEILMNCPDALDVALVKTDAGHAYQYINPSKEASKVRKQVRIQLWNTWQGGAYSFSEVGQTLRVDDLSIKAALDPEWREEIGLE